LNLLATPQAGAGVGRRWQPIRTADDWKRGPVAWIIVVVLEPIIKLNQGESSTMKSLRAKSTNRLAVCGLAFMALFGASMTLAASKQEIDASVSTALSHFNAMNPSHRELERKAVGMLVFPRVTKGGVGVAGEYGEGALLVGGQTVGYYSVSSASVGVTIGLAKHREILLFMTQEALDKFRNSKGWSVGADASVALVKVGAGGQYDNDTLSKPILGFVFGEKGLLADLSLEGSKINSIDR
jgi:lipid-binding SYLF domain-containing protein